MREAQIDSHLCDGCQDCLELCPYDAIDLVRIPPSRRMTAQVDPGKCCGCQWCFTHCPQHGIEMVSLIPLPGEGPHRWQWSLLST